VLARVAVVRDKPVEAGFRLVLPTRPILGEVRRRQAAQKLIHIAVRLVEQRQQIRGFGFDLELRLPVAFRRDLPHGAKHLSL